MVLPSQMSLHEPRRFGRVALTALVIGLGVAAVSALPFADVAFADKGGNGKGGGGGNGGGHGGGHGGGGGSGGGNGGGNANGHEGSGGSANAGKSHDARGDQSDDDSMSPSNLGKLNGFFHASPSAMANASPNSAIGKISQTFKDALSAYAQANQTETEDGTGTETDAEATPPTGPSIEDLGAILAAATNKPVSATQVQAIIDRVAEQNPDDAALNDFADNEDEATAQDIADAANAAKSGATDDGSDDDSADGDTTDTSGDTTGDTTDDSANGDTSSTDDTTVTPTATN